MRKKHFIFFGLLFIVYKSLAQPFPITASIGYNNSYATGTFQIYRNSSLNNISLNELRKTIVFVEGFDPNNEYSIGSIYYLINQSGLAWQFHNQGYDIVILNFDQGGDYIQKNSFLLIELIRQINQNKPNNEPLVVMGYSMGGLVARYALTYMEEHESQTGTHNTRLYVSYDSPHKGAHVPVSIQALALTFNSETFLQLVPGLASSINQFNAPAAKQMLKFRLSSAVQQSSVIPISPDYINFFNEMKNLNSCNGLPKKCRNIAVSLGSWNGIGQRSKIDVDNSPGPDLQHAGLTTLEINLPRVDDNDDQTKLLWELSTCEALGLAGFQIFLSSAFSTNYPYFSERNNYGASGNYPGIGNSVYATYWYAQAPFGSIFPSGSWSRFWTYEGNSPLDFAPGSYTNAYQQIESNLGSRVKCSFSLVENSTFVSTNSALSFDSDDLFYNISSDPNKLTKTPFDAIYGIDGENLSHSSGSLYAFQLNSSVFNEVINNLGLTCSRQIEELAGVVTNGQVVISKGNFQILGSNYYLESGSEVTLKASNSIKLKPGFISSYNSKFQAKIEPCGPKSCDWQPSTNLLRKNVNSDDFSNFKLMSDVSELRQKNNDLYAPIIQVFPNPNRGSFSIRSNKFIGSFNIYNTLGLKLASGLINTGDNKINFLGSSGIYFVELLSHDKTIIIQKIIIE
jgi:hypothetical protein